MEIARRRLTNARITAFAELFILDGPAYEEEHKDDAPFVNPYDENGEIIREFSDDYGYTDDYDDNDDDY